MVVILVENNKQVISYILILLASYNFWIVQSSNSTCIEAMVQLCMFILQIKDKYNYNLIKQAIKYTNINLKKTEIFTSMHSIIHRNTL